MATWSYTGSREPDGATLHVATLDDGAAGDGTFTLGEPLQGAFDADSATTVPGTFAGTVTFNTGPLAGTTWVAVDTGAGGINYYGAPPPGTTTADINNAFNNNFTTLDTSDFVTCFAEGTLIATARGQVPVEQIRVGDLVVTMQGGGAMQPVRWMGHTRVNLARHRNRAAVAPILISAGALAEGVPHRDLRVSPDHAIFLDGSLVPARLLVNGQTIVQELWCQSVTYWHVELESHGLLVSEGAVTESYFDDGNRASFDNAAVTRLVKDFESERSNGRYAEAACAPVLYDGAALDRIRAALAARTGKLRRSA